MDTIRAASVAWQSVVDGPGLRLVVFTQGCPHRCPGCHNPETHDFKGGYDLPIEQVLAGLDKNPLLRGVTLSGGEPLAQPQALLPLAAGVKARGKDIICFTGYTFEELLQMLPENPPLAALLGEICLLIDGRYEAAQRDITLPFRGSRNQRILDLPASLKQGRAVLKA